MFPSWCTSSVKRSLSQAASARIIGRSGTLFFRVFTLFANAPKSQGWERRINRLDLHSDRRNPVCADGFRPEHDTDAGQGGSFPLARVAILRKRYGIRSIAVATEKMEIKGMICGDCLRKVTRVLQAVPGVGEVHVSLAADEATVQFDRQSTTPEQLISAVQHAGFGVRFANPIHDHPVRESCYG